nr:unnamed protein product [Spirometra erinaceieuropaei]
MIFVACQLQEKCQKIQLHLHSTFMDLLKTFDTENHEGLRRTTQKFGCPERFIEMVRQPHDGMKARVTDNKAVSETFAMTASSRLPFISLMFAAMLMDAYRDERPGIRVAYGTDGRRLNH